MQVFPLQQFLDRFVQVAETQWGAADLLSHARQRVNGGERLSRADRAAGRGESIYAQGAFGELLLYDMVEKSTLAKAAKEEALAYMRAQLFRVLSRVAVNGVDCTIFDGTASFRVDTKAFDCAGSKRFFMINDDLHSMLRGQCDAYIAVLCPPYAKRAYVTNLIAYSDVSGWELQEGRSRARCYPIADFVNRYCSLPYSQIVRAVQETHDVEVVRHLAGRSGPGSIAADLTAQLPEITQWIDMVLNDTRLFPRSESFQASAVPPASIAESRIGRLSPSFRILRDIEKGVAALDDLSPREFETLIARLLEKDGYSIKLTRGTKDDGVDVFAEKHLGSHGYFSAVWQAKKKSLPGKVGLSVVRELADTRIQFNASKGIIVTSSYLTRGALERVKRERYILGKVDRDDLDAWIRRVLLGER